jgi:hypothetical protein
MAKVRYFFCALIGFSSVSTHGYELATHARLTEQAYEQFVLSQPLTDYGLDLADKDPFGAIYYDVSASSVSERAATTFEESDKRMSRSTAPRSIKGWLARGAIREDDLSRSGCFIGNAAEGRWSIDCNPQDDPYGDIDRVVHHFYDPINHRGLSIPLANGQRSPDWAIGTRDVFNSPNEAANGRRNHFSVFDAREAMYRALTGHDSKGNELTKAASGTLSAPEDIRKAYWATTFRALGDVAHLLQDMDYRMEHPS